MRSFIAHTLSAFILVAPAIPADAAIVSVTGPNGANGADADPGENGGPGDPSTADAGHSPTNTDIVNRATATGGNGGGGGASTGFGTGARAAPRPLPRRRSSARGGALEATTIAIGGRGGGGGFSGNSGEGGVGGNAFSSSSATATGLDNAELLSETIAGPGSANTVSNAGAGGYGKSETSGVSDSGSLTLNAIDQAVRAATATRVAMRLGVRQA